MDVVVSPEFESWLSIKRAQDSESKLGPLKPYAIVECLGLAIELLPGLQSMGCAHSLEGGCEAGGWRMLSTQHPVGLR